MIEKPFRLGTTSFIFPDYIIPNVEKLGPVFDEIELLLFESHPSDVLPSKEEINTLIQLSEKHGVSYNIHLPVDIDLNNDSKKGKQNVSDTYVRVIERVYPLNPTTCTLHLPLPSKVKTTITGPGVLEAWQENICKTLSQIVKRIPDPQWISIETLDYPFEYAEDIIEVFNFKVCIDAGHQIKYGFNLEHTFKKHRSNTPLIHLHGVDFTSEMQNGMKKDHTSLDKLPENHLNSVSKILKEFKGVVSLEIFNLVNLNRSLDILSQLFGSIPTPIQKNE